MRGLVGRRLDIVGFQRTGEGQDGVQSNTSKHRGLGASGDECGVSQRERSAQTVWRRT